MATSSVPEWYETDQAITASVKIKGMDADVFAVHFTDKYCIIDKNSKLNLLFNKRLHYATSYLQRVYIAVYEYSN